MTERWLLARPRGGLNDTLCQMEKCWRFAEKTGRQLVFDTRDSGLLLDFHEVFNVRTETSAVIPHRLTPELVTKLNTMSAFPADTQGNVTGYEKFKDEHDEFYTLPCRSPLKFSLKSDFPEDVIVYEGMGGGIDSFCALERLVLTDWLAGTIVDSLKKLPDRYISVHVRHSDMQTNYLGLFGHVKRRNVHNLPIFLASDNDAVLNHGRSIFGEDAVISLPSASERKGKPLHSPTSHLSEEERRNRTSEALAELFVLSRARRFFYTEVSTRTGVSGFSRLAAHLARTPALRRALMGSKTGNLDNQKSYPVLVSPIHGRVLEKLRWRRLVCR